MKNQMKILSYLRSLLFPKSKTDTEEKKPSEKVDNLSFTTGEEKPYIKETLPQILAPIEEDSDSLIIASLEERYPDIYFSEIFLSRVKRYPDLLEKLLTENIPLNIITMLNVQSCSYFPDELEYLWVLPYLDFADDDLKRKAIHLINNLIEPQDVVLADYIVVPLSESFEFASTELRKRISSLFSRTEIAIDIGNFIEVPNSSFSALYLPRSRYKLMSHQYDTYVSGTIELGADTIIEMSYINYKHLNYQFLERIAACPLIITEEPKIYSTTHEAEEMSYEINYVLITYQHAIFVIENSSLPQREKDKFIYDIKMFYCNIKDYWWEKPEKIISRLEEKIADEIEPLTAKFEKHLKAGKIPKIERPKFNASYFYEDNLAGLESMTVPELIDFLLLLSSSELQEVLKLPAVLQKFNLPSDTDINTISALARTIKSSLPLISKTWLSSLDFDYRPFLESKEFSHKSSKDINEIVSKYGVFDSPFEPMEVSIADIIGHDHYPNMRGQNILYTLPNFFSLNGDTYHMRANGLLSYKSGEEMLEGLRKRNNDTKDMRIAEIETGSYIIYSNGLHRYTLLRTHYLLDLMRGFKSIEELKKLYTIPVTLEYRVNYMRTYSNYLIIMANPDIKFISFQDGEIKIYYYDENRQDVISENALLTLVLASCELFDTQQIDIIFRNYEKYASFREYIDTNVPELSKVFKERMVKSNAKTY